MRWFKLEVCRNDTSVKMPDTLLNVFLSEAMSSKWADRVYSHWEAEEEFTSLNSGFRVFFFTEVLYFDFFPMSGCKMLRERKEKNRQIICFYFKSINNFSKVEGEIISESHETATVYLAKMHIYKLLHLSFVLLFPYMPHLDESWVLTCNYFGTHWQCQLSQRSNTGLFSP